MGCRSILVSQRLLDRPSSPVTPVRRSVSIAAYGQIVHTSEISPNFQSRNVSGNCPTHNPFAIAYLGTVLFTVIAVKHCVQSTTYQHTSVNVHVIIGTAYSCAFRIAHSFTFDTSTSADHARLLDKFVDVQ